MTKVIRFPQVINLTKLARSTIYLRISEGTFPKPFNLGVRSVAWLESDIEDWIEQRIKESHDGGDS